MPPGRADTCLRFRRLNSEKGGKCDGVVGASGTRTGFHFYTWYVQRGVCSWGGVGRGSTTQEVEQALCGETVPEPRPGG